MGIYMGGLILGIILYYRVSASFGCFLWAVKSQPFTNQCCKESTLYKPMTHMSHHGLSIRQSEFIWGSNTRHYTSVHILLAVSKGLSQ